MHSPSLPDKTLNIARNKDKEQKQGQAPAQIATKPEGQFKTIALINFGNKLIPAPAAAQTAEQRKKQCSQGQKIGTDDKVLKVKNGGFATKWVNIGKKAPAQSTGQRKQPEQNTVQKS